MAERDPWPVPGCLAVPVDGLPCRAYSLQCLGERNSVGALRPELLLVVVALHEAGPTDRLLPGTHTALVLAAGPRLCWVRADDLQGWADG